MVEGGAKCAWHPDVAAVDLCGRCGSFLCGECVTLVGELAFCTRCSALVGTDRPTKGTVAALALAVAGLTSMVAGLWAGPPPALALWLGGAPAGLVGLALAQAERRRAGAALVPSGRRARWASVARALGLVHAAVVAGLVGVAAFLVLLHRDLG